MISKGLRPICPKVLHSGLAQILDQGRVHLYALDIGYGIIVHAYHIYGIPNGSNDNHAAEVTNAIIKHVLKGH